MSDRQLDMPTRRQIIRTPDVSPGLHPFEIWDWDDPHAVASPDLVLDSGWNLEIDGDLKADGGLIVGEGTEVTKFSVSTSDPSGGNNGDIWAKRDSVAADFSYALVQETEITSSITTSGAASTWLDYSSSPHMTISGASGEKWIVISNIVCTPGNSGYNHVRLYQVSNCTVTGGETPSYFTSGTWIGCIVAIFTLSGSSATIKFQHWSSAATGTHTIAAGSGGSGHSPLQLTAFRVAPA